MSLIGALNIGQSALAVQQAALQVTSNNIANAGNADYTRQTANIAASGDQQLQPGIFLGTGVNLTGVQRQIDDALSARLRSSASDASAASTTQQWLGQVEATFNELSDQDLSTQMSTFFNSWSNLANKPQDIGLRQVVLQNGASTASSFQNLRSSLGSLKKDVDSRLTAVAKDADSLAGQIATLNGQIATSEGGGMGQANNLRDQRDALLKKLSGMMDTKVIDTGDGMVNVLVNSEPLVTGTTNRGVTTVQQTVDGQLQTQVVFKADGGTMKITSGELGSLAAMHDKIGGVVDNVDALASNLILELNKLHASGQGLEGLSSAIANTSVADPTVALNDPKAHLSATPVNGSFVVHVKNATTGLTTSTLVKVDLDGLNGNDTTLNSLAQNLNAIDGITATVTGGKLQIKADNTDTQFSFSQDSSGALAVLGINSFFTGSDATNIAINPVLAAHPAYLAAAKNGEPADNQTALAIATLESAPVAALDGTSLKDKYQAMINGVAVDVQSAKTNAQATQAVQDTLESQRQALSGVSMDEEAINLVRQQRAFQGAAKLIAAVDEMLKTVMNLVQ